MPRKAHSACVWPSLSLCCHHVRLSLRLGNMYICTLGRVCHSEGRAAGKDTLMFHTEVSGGLVMLRGGEETKPDNS